MSDHFIDGYSASLGGQQMRQFGAIDTQSNAQPSGIPLAPLTDIEVAGVTATGTAVFTAMLHLAVL